MICELIEQGLTDFQAEIIVKLHIEEKSMMEIANEYGRDVACISAACARAVKTCPSIKRFLPRRGRRIAKFRKVFPTPASQIGRHGLSLDTGQLAA